MLIVWDESNVLHQTVDKVVTYMHNSSLVGIIMGYSHSRIYGHAHANRVIVDGGDAFYRILSKLADSTNKLTLKADKKSWTINILIT